MRTESEDISLSVVFVCRNHSSFVLSALDSLLKQDLNKVEILIFDVASEDDSPEKIIGWRRQHAPNSFFHRYQKNVGIVRVVKDAMVRAKGEYVRLISTDDFFTEKSLKLQLEQLKLFGPEVAMCFADAKLVDQQGYEVGFRKGLLGADLPRVIDSRTARTKLMSGNWIAAPTVMLRRESVSDAIHQLDETIVFEDYQLWMELSERFDFLYLPEIVVAYRQHAGSFSSNRQLAFESLDGEIRTLRRAITKTPAMGFSVLRSWRQIVSRSLALGSFRLVADACLLAFHGVRLGIVGGEDSSGERGFKHR